MKTENKKAKHCEHPKNMHEVINNGGVYCKSCNQTNLYKPHFVKNDKGKIVFEGDAMECAKFLNDRS